MVAETLRYINVYGHHETVNRNGASSGSKWHARSAFEARQMWHEI